VRTPKFLGSSAELRDLVCTSSGLGIVSYLGSGIILSDINLTWLVRSGLILDGHRRPDLEIIKVLCPVAPPLVTDPPCFQALLEDIRHHLRSPISGNLFWNVEVCSLFPRLLHQSLGVKLTLASRVDAQPTGEPVTEYQVVDPSYGEVVSDHILERE
jgi:hypothetical protein